MTGSQGPRGGVLRRLRRAAKGAAAAALARLLCGSAPIPGPPRGERPRRILVIRIDERVGNVLLTTPILRALARALPEARVDVLVAASKARLVEGLARVIPFERRDLFVRPHRFVRVLRELRAANYDVAIDASHWHTMSVSSAALLAWTGAPIRIAHDRGSAHRFATHAVSPGPAPREVDAKLSLLGPLGLPIDAPLLATGLGAAEGERAWAEAWLEGAGLRGRPIVGLAPGGRKPDHRLPASLFGELGARARTSGAGVIVLWGPGEEALAREVAEAARATLAPPSDLPQLAALLRVCRVAVTNDTGPMHLSVACGVPTIALFSKADHGRWGHGSPPNAVIAASERPLADVLREASAALEAALVG